MYRIINNEKSREHAMQFNVRIRNVDFMFINYFFISINIF
jgi:hypothetical protein